MLSQIICLLLLQFACNYCDGIFVLSDVEKQELVDIHNKLRVSEGASNMQKMVRNSIGVQNERRLEITIDLSRRHFTCIRQ